MDNIVLQMTYVSSYDWMTQALRLSFCPGSMLTYSGYNLAYQLVLFFFFNIFLCDGAFEFLKKTGMLKALKLHN